MEILRSWGKMLHKCIRPFSYFVTSCVVLFFYNNCSQPFHIVKSSDILASQEAGFKCTDMNRSSPTQSYLLSKTQYQNTIQDLFGNDILLIAADDISTIFADGRNEDTYARSITISESLVDAYFRVAKTISSAVVASTNFTANVFGVCANQTMPAANCVDTYLNGFATRILRRPLTASERTFANQVMSTPGTYKGNLKALLTHHLISPYFIWRIELGTTQQASTTQINLTAYEVASRLAFYITDSTPDVTLLNAARDGLLMTPVGLQEQVSRLLTSPRGKDKLVKNLLRWSLNENPATVDGLPSELKAGIDTNGLSGAMSDEVRRFVEYIIYDKKGTYKDLLTSKESFASHPGLATIYEHSPYTLARGPQTFGGRRQGLLLRAPALTHSLARTNIIKRGVKFQKRVLCNAIPSPTVDIAGDRENDALTPAEILQVTNRYAVSHQTASPVCMSCHSTINPTGFALESFDSIGRYRQRELKFNMQNQYVRDIATDTTVVFPMGGNISKNVTDAYDLVTELAESPQASGCFIRQSFRYIYEKQETSRDGCQLAEAQKIVFDENKPILDVFASLLTHKFIYKKELF